MANTQNPQILRSSVPARVPTTSQLLEGQLGVNLADKILFVGTGTEVFSVNHADNLVQTEGKKLVSSLQIANWDAHATSETFGNVSVGTNIKVSEGVISLDTASALNTGVLSSSDWSTFSGKQDALGYVPVNKAGDTMLGALVLAGSPVAENEASNKGYVDSGLNLKLDLAGGSLSGPLVLASDPAQNLGAATKQYVDSSISNLSGQYAAPVQSIAALTALSFGDRSDKQIRLVEDTGAIFRFDAQSTEATIVGSVIIPSDLTVSDQGRWIKTSSATQNHNLLNNLQGGAENDYLHLTSAEKGSYESHLVDSGLHLSAEQNTWIDAINASSTEVNYLIGVTSSIQTQISSKQDALGFVPVNKAGDTLTGMLFLSGDPTEALHAVTKQYVDSIAIDGGTF